MKQSFLAIATSYFINYPGENEIYFTTDKQAFFSKNDATNHGKSLRKKEGDEVELITITRQEAEAPSEKVELTKEQKIEAAQDKLEKAAVADKAAQDAYDETVAKLNDSPDNKNLQKSEASRKAKLEEAKKAHEAAKKELEALSAE